MLALLIGAAVATSPIMTISAPAIADFDLAKIKPREANCVDRATSDDVVVCAPKNMNLWVGDVSRFVAKPVRAVFSGPLHAETSVHVIQQSSPATSSIAPALSFKWHF